MGSSGLSTARLDRMHEVLARHVESGLVPGLISLLSRRGETHVDVVGEIKVDGGPLKRDSLFRITSLTKPLGAVAAMILVEEGKIRLDEPVDRLLPELANRQVLKRINGPVNETAPAQRPITARDLLTFRSGLGMVFAPEGVYPIQAAMDELKLGQGMPAPQTPPEPDEWIRRLGTLPLIYQPDERWLYNTGSDVLGVLIARASGQPLETFLKERLFDPLGMKDTSFGVPAEKLDRFTTSYGTDYQSGTGGRAVYDEADGGQWSRLPAFPSLGSGIVSTVDDYFAFAQMLLNNGKHGNTRILSRPTVELMISDQLTRAQKAVSGFNPGDFDNRGYGFGMGVVTRRDDYSGSVGAYGWDGGFGTSWRNDPKEELITQIFTNRAWEAPIPPAYCIDFWASAYAAIDD